ncbi:MAG TPA: hypothetical protein VFL79_09305 [Terriglobia bacterium]|nr:hypothetical protein [Terriglobia bacterium]
MSEKNVSSQSGGGFLQLGNFFLIFLWLFLVIAGLGEGFAAGGAHRPVVGTAILVVAAAVFLWTMRRWAKIFPGLCTFAAFWAMVAIFTGHALGPNTPMTHAQAAIAMVTCGGAAFFTSRFKAKVFVPRLPDRLGTLVFISGIFWQAVDTRMTNLALGIGFFALFAAWLADRLNHRQRPEHHKASGTAEAN